MTNKMTLIKDQVIRIISDQLGFTVSEILPTKILIHDLLMDSLDTPELLITLEDEFGIEIPDEEIENITTVQEVIDYIQKRVSE